MTYAGSPTVQLKSAVSQSTPFLDRDLADLEQSVVVPVGVVAAELDLEALEAVAANPVAEQDRIAVVGLGAGQLAGVDRVLAADQVPGGDRLGPGTDQEILRDIGPRTRRASHRAGVR